MTEQLPSISTIRADVELALTYLAIAFLIGIRPENSLFVRITTVLDIRYNLFVTFWATVFIISAYACLVLKPSGSYHAWAALPLACFGSMCIVGMLLPSQSPIFIIAFMFFAMYLFFKNIRLQQEAKAKDVLLLRLSQQVPMTQGVVGNSDAASSTKE